MTQNCSEDDAKAILLAMLAAGADVALADKDGRNICHYFAVARAQDLMEVVLSSDPAQYSLDTHKDLVSVADVVGRVDLQIRTW